MNKEEIFKIMGSYYGNAHYRHCSNDTEHDLALLVELLNEINSLGYCFSNSQRIVETCDMHFPDILKKYIGNFDDERFSQQLIYAFSHKEYSKHVPFLLDLYDRYHGNNRMRYAISNTVLLIRARRYADEYLRIISEPGYEKAPDKFYELVCKLKLRQAIPRLLKLLELNEKDFKWYFISNIWRFHDEGLTETIMPYLNDPDPAMRTLAKKALEKNCH